MTATDRSFPQAASSLLTVSRGLQVLRAFKSERARLTNAELVRRTRLSKATVSRLTSTLLQVGFLRRMPGSREFELSVGALGVGQAFVSSNALLRAADPLLQELADRMEVSVALATGDGIDMVYVGYRASHRIATLRLGVGSVLPMATTSIGHAYLWGLPPPERILLLDEIRGAAGAKAATLAFDIERSFAELQTGGTCGVLGTFQRDAYGIALPVRVGRSRRVLGLSCGKAEVHPDVAAAHKRLAPALKEAAVRLEGLLADVDVLL